VGFTSFCNVFEIALYSSKEDNLEVNVVNANGEVYLLLAITL